MGSPLQGACSGVGNPGPRGDEPSARGWLGLGWGPHVSRNQGCLRTPPRANGPWPLEVLRPAREPPHAPVSPQRGQGLARLPDRMGEGRGQGDNGGKLGVQLRTRRSWHTRKPPSLWELRASLVFSHLQAPPHPAPEDPLPPTPQAAGGWARGFKAPPGLASSAACQLPGWQKPERSLRPAAGGRTLLLRRSTPRRSCCTLPRERGQSTAATAGGGGGR